MDEERYEILQGAFIPSLRVLKERSGDRLASGIDERISDQALEASMSSKPPGATQWTTHGKENTVVLTRDRYGDTSCNADLRASHQGLIPITNERAARMLDIDLGTWLDSRDIVERGMSNVSMSLAARHPEGEPNHGRVADAAERIAAGQEQPNRTAYRETGSANVSPTKPNSLVNSSFPTRPGPSTQHSSASAQPYTPPNPGGVDRGISK